MDAFMESGQSKLGRLVARAFNDFVMHVAPLKLSEEEHCLHFVYPISRIRSIHYYNERRTEKVQLRAWKSINQQLQTKGGPGEVVILLNIDRVNGPIPYHFIGHLNILFGNLANNYNLTDKYGNICELKMFGFRTVLV
ncbi:19967_t:CDS:2, partial [Gigaspora rosea]